MINNLLNWDYLPGMQDPVLSLAVFDKNIDPRACPAQSLVSSLVRLFGMTRRMLSVRPDQGFKMF